MHSLRRAQIAHLEVDKATSDIPDKYADFIDIFSPKLAVKFPEHIKINNYTIELVND